MGHGNMLILNIAGIGDAINPARDLAPRFIHFILPIKGKGSSHWEYAWVPVLGPIAGAAIAGMLYYVLK